MKKIDKDKIKIWLVTGASSGIGKQISKELLNRGYNVIAIARNIPDITHRNVLCLSVDVTKPDTINDAIKKGIEKFGKIDVLLNNAGITASVTLEEETLEHMKSVMETNFFGYFNTIHAILPHFRQNKNGTIINNISESGLTPSAYSSAYCSSKHALEGLTGVCLIETQKFCRVMSIEPGWFEGTNIIKNQIRTNSAYDEYKNLSPLHKAVNSSFKNDLTIALNCIIDTVELEKLPRRLILGKDAFQKINSEADSLRKDLKNSKTQAMKCSIANTIFNKIKLKLINILSNNKKLS